MSEVVVFSPIINDAIQKANKLKCLNSYMSLIQSMKSLPEETLVSGAIDYAKQVKESGVEDITGNTWLQALSLSNPELANVVQEMIESTDE